MGVGGFVFYIFKDFLTNRQRVSVDGNFSQFKPVVSSALQGSVLCAKNPSKVLQT